jgi:hypothetical protein
MYSSSAKAVMIAMIANGSLLGFVVAGSVKTAPVSIAIQS